MKKIGIVGFGNMGQAIALALLDAFPELNLALCDSDETKFSALLMNGREVFLTTRVDDLIAESEVIILAVKPQIFPELVKEIKVEVQDKLFVSIMAGVRVAKMKKLLKTEQVVRTMPNLPAQVRSGLTGFFAPEGVDKSLVREILGSFSYALEVQKEEDLDKITALSGSGPAYFFEITRLLEEKARLWGFDDEQARIIAEATFLGSARVFSEGEMSAEEWRNAVTSKGGTTEAALNIFNKEGFSEAFGQGLEAARQRSEEL